MKSITSLFLCVALAAAPAVAAVTALDIIPRPASVKVLDGDFLLADDYSNVSSKVTGKGAPESYVLTIKPKKAEIVAADSAGLFYGMQTLRQMRELSPDGRVACQRVEDKPRFEYRGLMFDVSRHFRSTDFIKKQIDAMARLKINKLHLHLTDGAGWRLEVPDYPRLAGYAAWRPQRKWVDWVAEGAGYCTPDTPNAYGGYYTADELRDLVDYAAKRHITIIPEIEMPGHSDELVAAYPEVSCSGKGGDVCPGKEATFEMLERILDYTMDIFPSHLIHIGGDEAGKGEWHNCPDCRKRMADEGLNTVEELQSYLIKRIERYVNSKGRSIIGWDEILEGGVAPNATIMSWRGTEAGVKSVNAEHDVIMTPVGYTYIDYSQDAPFREPCSIGGYIPLSKIYGYEPLEPGIDPDKAHYLKGLQANLWVEQVVEDSHAEYMYYPRAYAIAEVGWSTPEKDYPDFRRRALAMNERLKADGYNVFDLANEYGERHESLTPLEHLAVGAKIDYITPYSQKYAAAGNTTLTDGLRAGWSHSDGRWQGWTTDMELVLDLGKVTPIHYVGASFMHSEGAWIHLPEWVTYSVSTDGTNFTDVATIDSDVDATYPKIMVKDFGSVVNTEARYIKMRAKQNPRPGAWLFIDEFVVN